MDGRASALILALLLCIYIPADRQARGNSSEMHWRTCRANPRLPPPAMRQETTTVSVFPYHRWHRSDSEAERFTFTVFLHFPNVRISRLWAQGSFGFQSSIVPSLE